MIREINQEPEIAELKIQVSKLQDLAIWMTGCGYDFCQHEFFTKNQHLLTDGIDESEVAIDEVEL